jgi:hypothetical protein
MNRPFFRMIETKWFASQTPGDTRNAKNPAQQRRRERETAKTRLAVSRQHSQPFHLASQRYAPAVGAVSAARMKVWLLNSSEFRPLLLTAATYQL